MASQQASSQSTPHEAASTPASTTSSSSASFFSASFSVFQEGPGQPLVFSPPLHTPELQALVDRFLTLDVPISMKMDMLRCDFEAHVARTNERYKTYFVPAASPASAPAVAAVPSPSVFTASPTPLFFPTLDASATGSLSSSSGGRSNSGSFIDAPSVQRPLQQSPAASPGFVSAADTASSSVFPPLVPMFPSIADYSAFYADAASASSSFAHPPAAAAAYVSTPSTSTPSPRSARGSLRPSRVPSQRRHLTDDSLQIVTRTGVNVTHVSSRATRTNEDRESTRLVRQRGACADCRRKKQRCTPGHAGGAVIDRSVIAPRPVAPYPVPVQSGRAKQEAAAAQATRATQEKVEGKRPEAIMDQPVLADAAWATNNSPLPSSVSPANDLSLLDSLLDWGDLDTTTDMFLFSSGTDEDLSSASASAAVALPTALAGVRPPVAAAHGQSLYYASQQQPATMNRPRAPTPPPVQVRALEPVSMSASVGSSPQLQNSRDELNALRRELQFSTERLQALSSAAAHMEHSAFTAVPKVDTLASMAGGAVSSAASGSSGINPSLIFSSDANADTSPDVVRSIVFSSASNTVASADVNPIVFSSKANTAASSEVRPTVFSSDTNIDASPDVNPIVFSSERNTNASTDVSPIVHSSDTNADVSSPDANPIVYSSDATVETNSSDANPIVFSSDNSSDVCSPDVHPDACSSDTGSDQKAEDPQDTQAKTVAAAKVLLALATMASVAESLLPTLAIWSSATASGAAAADLSNELEGMHLGVSPIACQ